MLLQGPGPCCKADLQAGACGARRLYPALTSTGRRDLPWCEPEGYTNRQWHRAVSSAGEHYLDMVGAIGSIPIPPTILQSMCGIAAQCPFFKLSGLLA